MKIEITDEMKRKALDVLAVGVGGCPGLGLSGFCDDTKCECLDEIGAALETIAPIIADQALERVAVHIDHKIGSVAADAIRALKEPT